MSEISYKIVTTNIGLTKLDNAFNTGVKVNIKAISFGDSNGTEYTPTESCTDLINIVHTSEDEHINHQLIDGLLSGFEVVIPEDTPGEFWIREMGVYDDDGDLIFISAIPPRKKTDPNTGSAVGMVFGVEVDILNSDVIEFISNSNLTYVTRVAFDLDMAGKLNTTATAANSLKLGGQLPAYFAKQSDLEAIAKLLLSDETSLDELQEIVDYIQLNRADLDSLGLSSIAGLVAALAGKQAAGTYNQTIGTSANVSTSGAKVISSLTLTDGVVTNHATRTLTAANLSADTSLQVTEKILAALKSNVIDYRFLEKGLWPAISNYTSDLSHDIEFSAGTVVDSTGLVPISASYRRKRIDATWSAGSGSGGRFSGVSLAASMTLHCFVIIRDSDGYVDAGFDSSPVATNRPSGYTAYRRIGSIVLDDESNIVRFYQQCDRFYLYEMKLDAMVKFVGNNDGPVDVVNDLSAPGGLSNLAVMLFVRHLSSLTGGYLSWIKASSKTDYIKILYIIDTEEHATTAEIALELPMDANAQLTVCQSDDDEGTFYGYTRGWIDDRTQ